MSAIWGCVDLSGKELPMGLGEAMQAPVRPYKIDRFAEKAQANVLMGCGIQYFTAEAVREPLPIFDEEEGLCFTADCFLDNREELIAQLCPGQGDIPDGQLLYLAYKQWREALPQHVLGVFSYAVYHQRENRLVLCVDHVLNRSLYYCQQGNKIYFSTLVEPIVQGMGGPAKLNEDWAAMFLAISTLMIEEDPVATPYEGVLRMVAGHYTVFDAAGTQTVEYWNPTTSVKPMKLANDEEYRQRFCALMETAAKQVTRSDGQVGILLSSGFDSTAVAAFAAPVLAQQEKKLFAYTHVPVPGHESAYDPRVRITNEQPGVERFCALYPNIVPHFMPTPQRNAIDQTRDIMRFYDIPYKSLTNASWLDALNAAAAQDGCKIMLDGQEGNVTISAGSAMTYMTTKLLHGRVTHALGALNRYCRVMHYRRKPFLKYMLTMLIPYHLRRLPERDWLKGTFINRQWAQSRGIKKRDHRLKNNSKVPRLLTYRQEFKLTYNRSSFAHLADQLTKRDLYYGMLTRDITKDKRMFEFCMSLPLEVRVNEKPQTRRLVRCYLADRLPAEMLPENAPRGRQSGDWLERLMPNWPSHYQELCRVCLGPAVARYIDVAKVQAVLQQFADGPAAGDEMLFLTLGYVYVFGIFLEGRSWQDREV